MKFFAFILGFLIAQASFGADLSFAIRDKAKTLLDDAVVIMTPIGKQPLSRRAPHPVALTQEGESFTPSVVVVQVGGSVVFPNLDSFNHHVYSMSKTKSFELPLYKKGDKVPAPVRFDKSGVVVVGCNIHDEMIAYIVVVGTPYFAKSVKGQAEIKGLPSGRYKVEIWHSTIGDVPRVVKADLKVPAANPVVALEI